MKQLIFICISVSAFSLLTWRIATANDVLVNLVQPFLISPVPSPMPADLGSPTGEICTNAVDEIAGTVFEDWNYDGGINQPDTIGVSVVMVIATDCSGASDTTYTDDKGNYQFSNLTARADYRIAFVLPTTVSDWASPTHTGAENGTMVQFVQAGDCAHLGLSGPGDYCEANPSIATTCFVNGDGSTAVDAVVSVQYGDRLPMSDLENNVNTAVPLTKHAFTDTVGALWGLAYQRSTNTLFSATFYRGHAGLGIGGMDAVYLIDPANNYVKSHFNLSDFGAIAYSGPTADPRTYTLPSDPSEIFTDPLLMKLAGKTGLGDIDISDDGHTLYVMNVHDKKIVTIDITDPLNPGLINTTPIPNTVCSTTPRSYQVNMGRLVEASLPDSDIGGWQDGLNSAFTNKDPAYIGKQADNSGTDKVAFNISTPFTNTTGLPNGVVKKMHADDDDDINVNFPVTSGVDYVVDLYFLPDSAGHIFDILLDGVNVEDNYSPAAAVVEQKTYNVVPTDGVLSIDFRREVGFALINAIRITPVVTDVTVAYLPNDVRPFALKYHRGALYVGLVCSGETSQNPADLSATVYKMDVNSNAFTVEYSMPLNYDRGSSHEYDQGNNFSLRANPFTGNWAGWQDSLFYSTPNNYVFSDLISSGFPTTVRHYPQPILADIEFDTDGSLVLGFIDRSGVQTGIGFIQVPELTDTQGIFSLLAGDVLRICSIDGGYVLEGDSACIQNFGPIDNSPQSDQNHMGAGANGGEYYDDNGVDDYRETMVGGIAMQHGQLLMNVLWHPSNGTVGFGGSLRMLWLDNKNGSQLSHVEITDGGANIGGSENGKGNTLGDIEFMCAEAPIEIGNYVWIDLNEDGVADACEPPLAGINMTLYGTNGDSLATVITDVNGAYYFNETTLVDTTLLPNTDYHIVVGNGQFTNEAIADTLVLTLFDIGNGITANQIDSDINPDQLSSNLGGVIPDGLPYMTATTTGVGKNNHTYDVGWKVTSNSCLQMQCIPVTITKRTAP